MTREPSLRRSLLFFLCLQLITLLIPLPARGELYFALGSGGNITCKDLGGSIIDDPENYQGTAVLTFLPNPGYFIQDVKINGTSQGALSSIQLELVLGVEVTVDVAFSGTPSGFTVTPVLTGNGTVTSSCGGTVPAGGSCTLTLSPGPGLSVGSPTVSGSAVGSLSTSGGYHYTVSNVQSNVSVMIPFGYRLTVLADNATISKGGAILSSGDSLVVPQGEKPTVIVTPATGYACVSVTTPAGAAECMSNYTYELAALDSDGTLTVTTARGYHIDAGAGAGGTISPTDTVVLEGQSQNFVFSTASDYVIDTVVVDNILQPPAGSYLFSNVRGPHSIYVTFKRAGASMANYCNAPPFVASGVKSNLLLLIDNSSSMYDLAYTAGKTDSFCMDDSFNSSASYPGYFQQGTLYSYDSTARRFLPVDALPASCNAASSNYLCVNLQGDANGAPRVANVFAASGKFLNWLSTSKLDLEKQVLTGGKFLFDDGSSGKGRLIGESRGCQGKRFVKLLPNSFPGKPTITFAVRGPLPTDDEYTYQASLGGLTRIEIYDKGYQAQSCKTLVKDWRAGARVDDIKSDIQACLNSPTDSAGVASRGLVYSIIMSDCYGFLKTNALYVDQDLLTKCQGRRHDNGADPSKTNLSQLDDSVCTNNLRHATHDSDTKDAYRVGYLGRCVSSNESSSDANCLPNEMTEYCLEIKTPTVTDPAATADASDSKNANIPSFVIEAGIASLGKPAGTFLAQVQLPAPPTGQIQDFSSRMNMGAMIFNSNGAGSECHDTRESSEVIPCLAHCSNNPAYECYSNADCTFGESSGTCDPAPPTDGGQVVSYINHSPLGEHGGSGLIGRIDAITANSWTPFAEAFYDAIGYFANRSDLRLQEGDFDLNLPPSQYSCQKNSVLIVSDGMSTADSNRKVSDLAYLYRSLTGNEIGRDEGHNCPAFQGSRSLDDLAWLARNRDIATLSTSTVSGDPPKSKSHFISTYAIYLGSDTDSKASGQCDPVTLLTDTANKGGGRFYNSPNPADMEGTFRQMLQDIAGGTNSGGDASFLSTGDGNGALFLQPLFYTEKSFDNRTTAAKWLGELQALWLYIDPFLGGSDGSLSTVREDTGGDHVLDLKTDRVVEYVFDSESNEAKAKLYLDANGDGKIDPSQPSPPTVAPDEVKAIWRAGVQLWKKDPSQRKIYTVLDPSQTALSDFTTLDADAFSTRTLLQATDAAQARAIRDFALGKEDLSAGVRDRSVVLPAVDSTERVWKLGDIISSTPRVQSHVPLNGYHLPDPRGYHDVSYRKFISTGDYGKRGMVYVGANDGMLHAFRMGNLRQAPRPADLSTTPPQQAEDPWPVTQKAALSGTALGDEAWAFVPRNALPYLKYLKEPLYTHLYYVDGPITLSDVSIGRPASCSSSDYSDCFRDFQRGSNWRTVLIGGMGLGGATRAPDDTCSDAPTGSCVKAPTSGAGFSSYFALDVTDQLADSAAPPTFLWEFAPPGLGYATSGAAIVKISGRDGDGKPTPKKNGKSFAVFGSGPTGPIDCNSCQFKGSSDQHLKFFVVDLGAKPPLVQDVNYWVIDTGIADAFAGSISGGGIDADRGNGDRAGWYQDDAVYLGYARKPTRDEIDREGWDGTWNKGGVVRLLTREDPDPRNWAASTVLDGTGPVTGGIAKLQDKARHNLWLYFGTGRYSYNQDDMSGARALYGIKEPCYSTDPLVPDRLEGSCRLSRSLSELTDKTTDPSDTLSSTRDKGWFIGLRGVNTPDAGFGSERMITTPTSSTAGMVLFSTFKPSTDRCYLGGKSYLWQVKYDSGGAVAPPRGKTLLYSSTGGVIGSTDPPGDAGGRVGPGRDGSLQDPHWLSNASLQPVRRILHMQER